MSTAAFDREWQLRELLDAPTLARLGPPLAALLGGDCSLSDANGHALWGVPSSDAPRMPLTLELEPIGFLSSHTANAMSLAAGQKLLTTLLRSQSRYLMTSSLHLEAVAEDFATLKREHAHLLESEARYKKLSAELDTRVKAQIAELEDRQQMLYEAEKLASVGQLAAGMAHEINNPLGFVRSNLNTFRSYLDKFARLKNRLDAAPQVWQEEDLDFVLGDAGELLDESAQGIERIARIISDLKSFSNVDRATEEFADINDCLRHVADIMRHHLPAGVDIALDLQATPRLICLPGHLNQLFFNLVRNGIQAIEQSGHPGSIRISSRASEHGIEIKLSDNGVGMNAEQLDKAFEPFYTTRPVGAGTGLGLTTARNIVLAHSGEISLDSQLGEGTTVTLFFPTQS